MLQAYVTCQTAITRAMLQLTVYAMLQHTAASRRTCQTFNYVHQISCHICHAHGCTWKPAGPAKHTAASKVLPARPVTHATTSERLPHLPKCTVSDLPAGLQDLAAHQNMRALKISSMPCTVCRKDNAARLNAGAPLCAAPRWPPCRLKNPKKQTTTANWPAIAQAQLQTLLAPLEKPNGQLDFARAKPIARNCPMTLARFKPPKIRNPFALRLKPVRWPQARPFSRLRRRFSGAA